MKLLLIVSAVIEGLVGAAMLVLPSFTASTLLGVPLDTSGGLVIARIAGAALLALAIACWNARNGERSGPAKGIVTALLFYNFAAVAVLVWAGIRLQLSSPMIWPTIVMHLAMGAWCAISLWSTQRKSLDGS